MAWTPVEDAVYAASKAIMPSRSFVIADQNGPELKTPYGVINVVQQIKVGREAVSTYPVTIDNVCYLKQELQETYEVLVRIYFVGKDSDSVDSASNIAADYYSALNNPTKRYFFSKNNLSVMRMSALKRAPVIKDTDRYNAYSVDVTFAFCLKTTENIDYFDVVSVSGEITGTTNDPYIINEFTIPS